MRGDGTAGIIASTRQEQEQLTLQAMAIIEQDRRPRVPPTISIRECQKAIEIGGGIKISLRGRERLITEVKTGGAGNPRWFSGGLRFTSNEQERLTGLAREIIEKSRKIKGQLRYSTWSKKPGSPMADTEGKTGGGGDLPWFSEVPYPPQNGPLRR